MFLFKIYEPLKFEKDLIPAKTGMRKKPGYLLKM